MKRRNSLARTLVQLSVLVVLVVAGLNYQFIWDQYALATFKPTTDVAQIEGQLALTQTGRALFYRGQPQIDSKTQFNADCQTSRGMLELGCYYLSRIYVLHIEDARLAPEMQVVAAHELLHAAWLRLSRGEQATLTTELEQVYAGIQDQDLRDHMASYAKSEPGE
ncbi:MAG TPA: hypothetical protein VLF67_05025, partial [Candidatus Saccharimonas sp.]|nr:hypothetical protein [Candidatus Saccharimonas sp.]